MLLSFQIFPLWRSFSKACVFIENNTSFSTIVFVWTGHENATKCLRFQMKTHPCGRGLRLQLLHFHGVFKTWPTFQELKSIVSFRRRRWSQRDFSVNRNIRALRRNIFLASRLWLSSRLTLMQARAAREIWDSRASHISRAIWHQQHVPWSSARVIYWLCNKISELRADLWRFIKRL